MKRNAEVLEYLEREGVEIGLFNKNGSLTVEDAVLSVCEFCRYVRDTSVDSVWIKLDDPVYDSLREILPSGLAFDKAVPVVRVIMLATELNGRINEGQPLLRELLTIVHANSQGLKPRGSVRGGPPSVALEKAKAVGTSFEIKMIQAFKTAAQYRETVAKFKKSLEAEQIMVEKACLKNEEIGAEIRLLTDENQRLIGDYVDNDVAKSLKDFLAAAERERKIFEGLNAKNGIVQEKEKRVSEQMIQLKNNIAAQMEKLNKANERIRKYDALVKSFPDGLEDTYNQLAFDKENIYDRASKTARDDLDDSASLLKFAKSVSAGLKGLELSLMEWDEIENRVADMGQKTKSLTLETAELIKEQALKEKELECAVQQLEAEIRRLEGEKARKKEELGKITKREDSMGDIIEVTNAKLKELTSEMDELNYRDLENTRLEREVATQHRSVVIKLDEMERALQKQVENLALEVDRTVPWMQDQLNSIPTTLLSCLHNEFDHKPDHTL